MAWDHSTQWFGHGVRRWEVSNYVGWLEESGALQGGGWPGKVRGSGEATEAPKRDAWRGGLSWLPGLAIRFVFLKGGTR